MDRLKIIESQIKKEYLNLEKSKLRTRTLHGIQAKRTLLQEYFSEYRTLLKTFEFRLKTTTWNEAVETYASLRKIYEKCIKILDNTTISEREYDSDPETCQLKQNPRFLGTQSRCEDSLLRTSSNISIRQRTFKLKILVKLIIWFQKNQINKMALSIKTASELAGLIPAYNGNAENLNAFTDALTLVKTIIPADNKASAIQLIMTKLNGKARSLFAEPPQEIDEIINRLKIHCVDKCTSDLALTNLKSAKCKNNEDFKQIEILTDKLQQTYVREQIPNEVAAKMARKAAIQTIINNSNNNDTKMMLRIGKFDTLEEAINLAMENEQKKVENNTSSVLQINRRYNQTHMTHTRHYQSQSNFRGNHQRNFRGQEPRRFQSTNNANQRFAHQNNGRNFHQNSTRGYHQSSGRGYYQNSGQRYNQPQNNNQRFARAYVANQQQNVPLTQPTQQPLINQGTDMLTFNQQVGSGPQLPPANSNYFFAHQ